MNMPRRLVAVVVTAVIVMFSSSMFAAEHTINAEARAFNSDIVYVQPGDTVGWMNMTSHNSKSMIVPDGAENWESALGENIKVTLDKEGIYGYVCVPHIGFGMVGVIVVGNVTQEMKDATLKKADEALQGPFRRLIGKLNKVEIK